MERSQRWVPWQPQLREGESAASFVRDETAVSYKKREEEGSWGYELSPSTEATCIQPLRCVAVPWLKISTSVMGGT